MKKSNIAIMALMVCLTVCACSSKNSSTGLGQNQGTGSEASSIAGYYTSEGDFKDWTCMLMDDGSGSETAVYPNSGLKITVPFTWEIKGDQIVFTFDTEQAYASGGDESSETIKEAAMSGYSEPRECTIAINGNEVTIDGEGIYPTYKLDKNMTNSESTN